MNNYKQLIARLFSRNLFGGMKLGLENINRLDAAMSHPHRSFNTIHVAGTNGKGSVSGKIAKALELAGYRVGLFTSPHISCFRERIRINGKMIPEKAIEKILSKIFELADRKNIPATYFELTTMLALQYFSRQKVDFAVLETGLGGRWDATNIVTPVLSVITSISLDHTETLGNTRLEIAREKAGIIKTGVPVVVGVRACPETIKEIALWKRSVCIEVGVRNSSFDRENRNIAKAALLHLRRSYNITDTAIMEGLRSILPCRFEVISKDKILSEGIDKKPEVVVLDVAHNPDAFERLFLSIARSFPDKPIRIVTGISKGKDLKACFGSILQRTKSLHLVEASNGRGYTLREMESVLAEKGVKPESLGRSVRYTMESAMGLAAERNEVLLVCGSFFIMGEARKFLGMKEAQDLFDMNERF
ncbi:MAG: dihydrofolate synthase/folylpolyglutamate synthase [Chlamydiales bacterium]